MRIPANLNKIDAKKKIIAVTAFSILAAGAIVYFLIMPSFAAIAKARNDIISVRKDVDTIYRDSFGLRRQTEKWAKIEPQKEILDGVFINQNRELEFVTTLEDLSARNRVAQKISLGAPAAAKKGQESYQQSTLEMQITGYFVNLLNYLLDLEALSYYINIGSIDLQAGGAMPVFEDDEYSTSPPEINTASNRGGAVTMTINAVTYWQ